MAELFQRESECVISDCGLYRYLIREIWDFRKPRVGWVLYNPSTATADETDATKSRIRNFTIAWGYGGFLLANQHAGGRSPNPGDLSGMEDPTGPDCDKWLAHLEREADLIVVAWGDLPQTPDRTRQVVDILRAGGKPLHCLGTNASGSPKHPIARGRASIPRRQQPVIWQPAVEVA
ncbi:MAG TPA: DUF1643 domain-containing protein [Dyella sp.]|uniref:DUF1643 domain-containing protein n=1 Tax=Dyella sp. TaxID=1869338 RepID=UPI002C9DD474|nr:DUF1643 domain-containing protein [Dyella sp.]HUB88612.1 DUF1643 domain-containing protein [Dyella sp.]